MNDISQAFNIKDSALYEEDRIDTILECLTDQCKDCSGSYINKLFGHRLICACKCHNLKTMEKATMAKTAVPKKGISDE